MPKDKKKRNCERPKDLKNENANALGKKKTAIDNKNSFLKRKMREP